MCCVHARGPIHLFCQCQFVDTSLNIDVHGEIVKVSNKKIQTVMIQLTSYFQCPGFALPFSDLRQPMRNIFCVSGMRNAYGIT